MSMSLVAPRSHGSLRRTSLAVCVIAVAASGCVLRKGPGGDGTTPATNTAPPANNIPTVNTATTSQNNAAPQPNDPNAPSNFGIIQIARGFRPDPAQHAGTSGGRLNAQQAVNQACRGWIAPRPDHILQLDTPFEYLRLETNAPQDTTLIVRGADGVRCDDDSAGNRNARIAGAFPAGRYEVWIGSYQEGQYSRYELTTTEYRVPGEGQGQPNPNANTGNGPRYGAVQLQPGFQPDPQAMQGQAGGQTDVRQSVAHCRGWIAADRPDHQITLTQPFNYLRVEATSAEDTTLVIQGPNGTSCDDDSAGNRNPRLEGTWPAGTYNVWIGSYNQGRFSAYQLQITERRLQAAAPVANAPAATPLPATGSMGVDGRYGNMSLAPGFAPQPTIGVGQSGGRLDIRTTNDACRGWIASDRPDHVITLTQPFSYLRMETSSGDDTTLVVRGEQGLRCDDDSAGHRNARLEGTWQAGRYEVWIGSFNQGQNSRYELNLTEARP